MSFITYVRRINLEAKEIRIAFAICLIFIMAFGISSASDKASATLNDVYQSNGVIVIRTSFYNTYYLI